MGKSIDIEKLGEFGKMIAEKLDQQGMNMNELSDRIGSNPASMSRFLRLSRQPPPRIIDRIIDELKFSKTEAEELKKLAQTGSVARVRSSISTDSRMLAMRFGEYDLGALMCLIQSMGWHCELSGERDEYAYDMKVAEVEGQKKFVAINFPNPRRTNPETLRRGAGAMAGAHQGLRVTVYYEGVAGGLAAFEKNNPSNQLALDDLTESASDDWLKKASDDKGRIAHGGNLIRTLAEYLKPTDAVEAYLKAQ